MQKGSQVTDSMVTAEVIGSSKHVLTKSQHGNFKGLQQFYTPPEAAKMIAQAVSNRGEIQVPVFDPTAGDGSLLAEVNPTLSFGVELDPDQVKNAEGSYQAIKGDIQKVFPLIYRACPEFPLVFANPPFGLKDWSDATVRDGKAVGSARLAFIYASRILSHNGQIVFISGKEQFYREIAELPEAKGVYYVVEVDDLFEGTDHPAAIAFAVHPEMRHEVYLGTGSYVNTEGFETKKVPLSMLDLLPQVIREARAQAIGQYNKTAADSYWPGGGRNHLDAFEAIQKEYNRRKDVAEGKERKREYDIELTGGKILNSLPSPYSSVALAKMNMLGDVKRLHGKPVDYFANYERDWHVVEEAMAADAITVDPRVIARVEDVLRVSRRTLCPLYPINKVQRLGYLTDLQRIKCIKTDEEKGFIAGETYEIDTRTGSKTVNVKRWVQARSGKNAGELVERTYEQSRKVMFVTISNPGHQSLKLTDSAEDQDDIAYLVDHFEMPDPGDVGTRFPQETEANRQLLQRIEKEVITPNSVTYQALNPDKPAVKLRHFQREDLARLLVKKDGMIAWEQGLGKTLGALTFTKASWEMGAQECALYIVPQDLIPQWQEECKRFLGREMTLIKTHGQAKNVAKKLKLGGKGLYVTYYEALAVNGTNKSEMLPEVIVETKTEMVRVKGSGRYGPGKLAWKKAGDWVGVHIGDTRFSVSYSGKVYDPEHTDEPITLFDSEGDLVTGQTRFVPKTYEIRRNASTTQNGYIPEMWEEVTKNITSKHICPQCSSDRQSGWNGKYCRGELNDGTLCGYSHYLHRVKPMGSLLTTAFKKGVIVVDEGTMIQGDYSLRSTVVRGLRARSKLLMSGTPIKNYIPQAFWPLWWCLGNASKRFPYGYADKADFENNHAVIEWPIIGGKKGTRTVLPEVTNLSHLWRLLASSIIRRRKEETGEPLVKRTLHPITVPYGEAQREQAEHWRKHFHVFFAEKYPDSDVVKAGAHELMAPMLGMGWKMDFAATMPEADPDFEWTQIEGVSNYTPNNLRTLEVAMALVKQGRKVLIGTHIKGSAKWMEERLTEKGVLAKSLLDANGNTVPPAKRSAFVDGIQNGKTQVLVATIQALRLGHNLDKVDAAVINGLPWDFESFDQFIARIHRLTSKTEVDVFVMIPGSQGGDKGSITRRKWDSLLLKGDAASLALDGRLIEQAEEPVSEADVLKQMMESGIVAVGDEVPESEIKRTWDEISHIDHYEAPEGLLTATLDIVTAHGEEYSPRDACEAVCAFIEAFAPVEQDTSIVTEAEEVEAALVAELAAVETVGDFLQATAPEPEPQEEPEPFEVEAELVAEEQPDGEMALFAVEDEEPEPVQAAISPQEAAEAIRSFKELYDLGALDDAEFAEAKAAVLSQMRAGEGVAA